MLIQVLPPLDCKIPNTYYFCEHSVDVPNELHRREEIEDRDQADYVPATNANRLRLHITRPYIYKKNSIFALSNGGGVLLL